jgi:hypothetical protein
MNEKKAFLEAYHEFRESVDFEQGGILPEYDHLVWCMLMGVPDVPADRDLAPDAPMTAIDQRVAILKAVFVEVNGGQTDDFLDKGLGRYDRAGRMARKILEEEGAAPENIKFEGLKPL